MTDAQAHGSAGCVSFFSADVEHQGRVPTPEHGNEKITPKRYPLDTAFIPPSQPSPARGEGEKETPEHPCLRFHARAWER
jgi:hypothetical protein